MCVRIVHLVQILDVNRLLRHVRWVRAALHIDRWVVIIALEIAKAAIGIVIGLEIAEAAIIIGLTKLHRVAILAAAGISTSSKHIHKISSLLRLALLLARRLIK